MSAKPDWPTIGERVLEALRTYFAEERWLLEPATLVEAQLEFDPDGVAVLRAIYDHPNYRQRLGLRRRLDFDFHDREPEKVAEQIAIYDISEPLGRYSELLVEDANGVWWWGDGFPELRPPDSH